MTTHAERISKLAADVQSLEGLFKGKTAGSYGTDPMPYADLNPHQFTVWVTFARFGRTHHVTGNINRLEKLLEKIQSKIQANLKNMGIQTEGFDDVTVQDSNQKRSSVISFTIKPMRGTTFTDDAASAAWGIAGWKAAPWG